MTQDVDHWDRAAQDWITWARTPGHDAFWAYQDAFAELVGPGTCEVIDIGCGEGRQSRLLKGLGHRVTAVDPVLAMVDAARDMASADDYILAPATSLPLADDSFMLTLMYNCLMDIERVSEALKEAARVTRPGWRLIVSVVHPIADLKATDEGWTIDGPSYFDERAFDATVEMDGISMRFAGWARSLSTYTDAIAEVGFTNVRFSEPRASAAPIGDRHARWRRLPLFLWIEAYKESFAEGGGFSPTRVRL